MGLLVVGCSQAQVAKQAQEIEDIYSQEPEVLKPDGRTPSLVPKGAAKAAMAQSVALKWVGWQS